MGCCAPPTWWPIIRPSMVASTLIAYLVVYAFLLASYVLVLMYMASHPAQPTPQTPQSPKAATPVGGPA